jgi:ABC-type sugar transport system substrate-binding protein
MTHSNTTVVPPAVDRRRFLLAGAALLAAAGCRRESRDTFVIGFSQANKAEPWRTWMDETLMAEAARHPGLEVRYADAQQDNSKQVADVENFLRQRVDLLVISPNEARPLTAWCGACTRAASPWSCSTAASRATATPRS